MRFQHFPTIYTCMYSSVRGILITWESNQVYMKGVLGIWWIYRLVACIYTTKKWMYSNVQTWQKLQMDHVHVYMPCTHGIMYWFNLKIQYICRLVFLRTLMEWVDTSLSVLKLHLYWETRCKWHTSPPMPQANSGLAAAAKSAPKAAPVAAPVADTGSHDGGSGATQDWVMMRSWLYSGL